MKQELRENIKKLLRDKKVDLVIGWERGSLPLLSTPIFVSKEKDADNLIFDVTCQNNLTTYLTKDKRKVCKDGKKVGIVVKGCDARSLVLYVVEKQVKRDDVVIIGVPCEGVVDMKKLMKKVKTDIFDVNSYIPLPGALLYDSISEEDKKNIDWRKVGYKSFDSYFSKSISPDDFRRYRSEAYKIANNVRNKTIVRFGARMFFRFAARTFKKLWNGLLTKTG